MFTKNTSHSYLFTFAGYLHVPSYISISKIKKQFLCLYTKHVRIIEEIWCYMLNMLSRSSRERDNDFLYKMFFKKLLNASLRGWWHHGVNAKKNAFLIYEDTCILIFLETWMYLACLFLCIPMRWWMHWLKKCTFRMLRNLPLYSIRRITCNETRICICW